MNDFSDQDQLQLDKREVERKLLIIKAVREQMEEKDRIFKELGKAGIPSCMFRDDPFFL
jgi:hypothetical protein